MIIASIDIGSNTVLLLIAELNVEKQSLKVLFEDQKIPRIGQGLSAGKPFLDSKIDELLSILSSYEAITKNYNCSKVLVSATNAFRIASNRDAVIKIIRDKLKLEVNVISGNDEARLMHLGSTFGQTDRKRALIIDIGGGSCEIAYNKSKDNLVTQSLPIGVVTFREKYLTSDPPKSGELEKCISMILNNISIAGIEKLSFDKMIAVAGTPTTLACIKRNLKNYNEAQIEGDRLTKSDLQKFITKLSKMTSSEIKNKYNSVVSGREDVILTGTLILNEFMKYFNSKECIVSTRGVRYGAIYEYLKNEIKVPYSE